MHKSEVHLHYAYFKVNGKQYRILSTNFPKLTAGNWTSDFLGYFGLGSGEFWTARPDDIGNVGVSFVEIPDTEMSLLLYSQRPDFMGFVDASPDHPIIAILHGGEHSLYELPINWEVYTQLGVRDFAKDTLNTFKRAWIAYPSPEENVARVDDIIRMVQLF